MSEEQAGQPSAVPAAAPATPEPDSPPVTSQPPEADKTFDPLVEAIMSGSGGADEESQPPVPPAPAAPAVTPETAPPAPAAEAAPVPDEMGLDDPVLSDEDLRHAERAKHAFASIKGQLKKAREDGQFGNLIRRMGESAELDPDLLARWVDIGARLNRDDPSALQDLGRVFGARKLKLVPADAPAPAPMAPAPVPAAPPADRVAALAAQLYADEFKAKVDDFGMSEEVGQQLAAKMAERLLRAQAPSPSPALSQPISEPPSPPPAPQAPSVSFLQQAAEEEVGRYAMAYAARIPDFVTAVLPEVTKRIRAARQAAGGTSPLRWVSEFTDTVREVQAERTKPAAKPVTGTGLRPSTQTKGPSRAFTDVRESIAEAIMGGGLPD